MGTEGLYVTVVTRGLRRFQVIQRKAVWKVIRLNKHDSRSALGYEYNTLSKHFTHRGATRALAKLNRRGISASH